ncbi:MAG: hypothetical protein A4E73_00440 [Syntrophaceae bacterium PtaU1.Bin231]|nr:MAG: hypothetical protein A4E73_00440 [Syntrophaceae bacterium PtaU1.Bin231]
MTAIAAASVGVNQPVRMPPRMRTGAISAQKASLKDCQTFGRGSWLRPLPKSW